MTVFLPNLARWGPERTSIVLVVFWGGSSATGGPRAEEAEDRNLGRDLRGAGEERRHDPA
jgi:hypothetical protein